MKQTINLGAYGWRHSHWSTSFYPEDLPAEGDEDWRLAYYSNEFDTVLVPADYWQGNCLQAGLVNDCEEWLDSVHEDFQFFVECHASMFDSVSLADLTEALKILAPQLSALVLLDKNQQDSDAIRPDTVCPDDIKQQFIKLADALAVDVFALDPASDIRSNAQSAFAFIEDELSDLRSTRAYVEQYAAQMNDDEANVSQATIIVHHPQLQAGNLSKFRSVLEIMGY